MTAIDPGRAERLEWLEADGLGGFAMGTVAGVRTRRYHALLCVASTPPTGRFVLVNGLEAWAELPDGATVPLSTQRYAPDVIHPRGIDAIGGFRHEPWPRWTFRHAASGLEIEHELMVPHGVPACALGWRQVRGPEKAKLHVRLLLSGRDPHSAHHENPSFDFEPRAANGRLMWRPYGGAVPGVMVASNGAYRHEPTWYRQFLYAEERARGLDALEDLASPGVLSWDLSHEDAVVILSAEGLPAGDSATALFRQIRDAEIKRRKSFPSALHRAADAYVVGRGAGRTIVAGYPWFSDWGRDTFISLRGLCLATGRLSTARDILVEWAGEVSKGMLPNRFPDRGSTPEYNSVDASLWYVVAVHDYLRAASSRGEGVHPGEREVLLDAVGAILHGYSRGTRYGIRLDDDGLLAAGEAGVQLTWMDAKVGDWVVTPRMGKPVEVQALWLNALRIALEHDPRYRKAYEVGIASFKERFVDPSGGLYDVVDAGGVAGAIDRSVRPNQIFAVGGLPFALLEREAARAVVDRVERELLTPLGLRSLAPGSPGYVARYGGGVRERDGAYHQGTVWPWLIGPFVEAWVRVRGGTVAAKHEARARFIPALEAHLREAGLGHVSEIADADPPHTPRGCPFQAWSVGELLRLEQSVLV